MMSVPALSLPAWVWPDGRSWCVGVAAVPVQGGRLRFTGRDARRYAARPERIGLTLAFPFFGQPGACLEFLRLVTIMLHREATAGKGLLPVGLWRAPEPGFRVQPACPRHGRADPGDMARLAVRLMFEIESVKGDPVFAKLHEVVSAAVVGEDRAGPGFYDGMFKDVLPWLSLAFRSPTEAVSSLSSRRADPPPARHAPAILTPAAGDLAAFSTPMPAPAPAPAPAPVPLKREPGVNKVVVGGPSVDYRRPSGGLEANAPVHELAPAPPCFGLGPRIASTSLADVNFDPGLVAGVHLAGLSVHLLEVGTVSTFVAPPQPSGPADAVLSVRAYRTIVSLDPEALDVQEG